MKTSYEKNPKRILGYLMALFVSILILSDVNAQTNCVPNGATCICPMIYMPVCGCDGVMYNNSCLADCQGVTHTPAVSNGMPGGFLPCSTFVPSKRMTIGIWIRIDFAASTTPLATISQRMIPPKMLISTALTLESAKIMEKAFFLLLKMVFW